MIIFQKNRIVIESDVEEIDYIADMAELFGSMKNDKSFLLESVDIAPLYGQLSMFCVDPMVEVVGYKDRFEIHALDERGQAVVQNLPDEMFEFARIKRDIGCISGFVSEKIFFGDESERTHHECAAKVLPALIEYFQFSILPVSADGKISDKYFGMYGATSYDFVRYFEHLPERLQLTDTPYFHFYIPVSLVVSDHIKEQAFVLRYGVNGGTSQIGNDFFSSRGQADRRLTTKKNHCQSAFQDRVSDKDELTYIKNFHCNMIKSEFMDRVKRAQGLMKKGYLFEMVLSKKYQGEFIGDPFVLYRKYRNMNPSPYMFYFDFGGDILLGASPEMFARVDADRRVHTRPISGTAPRDADPMVDYDNMMDLLNSEKERTELDMLIDLGRNDVARVSKAGVTVSDYRYIEKYSRVMHTIAHVIGELDDRYSAFDAFVSLVNAGTLTGAPKIEAMKRIEEM